MTEAARTEPVQPKHEPTLETDGFEVREGQLGMIASLAPGLEQIQIRTIGDASGIKAHSEFLVFDPQRADAFGTTSTNRKHREALVRVLDEAGFRQFTPDFDIHVVVARTKPQPKKID